MNSSFPASLLNQGRWRGTCGYTETCQDFSMFLSTGPLPFIVWLYNMFLWPDVSCFFSTRSVAFPDLLSRPLPEAGGGQLQRTCRGSLCVQQSSWEEAGNPLEEGRTSPGPAWSWTTPSWPGRPPGRPGPTPWRREPCWQKPPSRRGHSCWPPGAQAAPETAKS